MTQNEECATMPANRMSPQVRPVLVGAALGLALAGILVMRLM